MIKQDAVTILAEALHDLAQLKSLVETVDEMLLNQARTENMEHPPSLLDGKHKTLLAALFARQRFNDLKILYPNTLWCSVFLASYALLENGLAALSECYHNAELTPIGPEDLKHTGIRRSRVFLSQIVALKIPENDEHCKAIETARVLRNCLAHASGFIGRSKNKQAILDIIAADKTLSTMEEHLQMSKAFVLTFLDHCNAHLESILYDNFGDSLTSSESS